MKNIRWTILAALILTVPTVAHAQAPAFPGAPGAPGAPTAATTGAVPTADTGAVTNNTTTDTTQTTMTSSPGIAMDSSGATISDDTTQLANTGGEPIILSLMGLSMAAGAFFLRRRVTG